MRSRRLTLNIISMVACVLVTLIFFLPTWYFSNITITNDVTTTVIDYTAKIYDFSTLRHIMDNYLIHGYTFDLFFTKIYLAIVILTLICSIVFIAFTSISIKKRFYSNNKLRRTCKILATLLGSFAILSFIISMIFVHINEFTAVKTEELVHILSINISSGVYLFTMLETCAAVCGFIANSYKE